MALWSPSKACRVQTKCCATQAPPLVRAISFPPSAFKSTAERYCAKQQEGKSHQESRGKAASRKCAVGDRPRTAGVERMVRSASARDRGRPEKHVDAEGHIHTAVEAPRRPLLLALSCRALCAPFLIHSFLYSPREQRKKSVHGAMCCERRQGKRPPTVNNGRGAINENKGDPTGI